MEINELPHRRFARPINAVRRALNPQVQRTLEDLQQCVTCARAVFEKDASDLTMFEELHRQAAHKHHELRKRYKCSSVDERRTMADAIGMLGDEVQVWLHSIEIQRTIVQMQGQVLDEAIADVENRQGMERTDESAEQRHRHAGVRH